MANAADLLASLSYQNVDTVGYAQRKQRLFSLCPWWPRTEQLAAFVRCTPTSIATSHLADEARVNLLARWIAGCRRARSVKAIYAPRFATKDVPAIAIGLQTLDKHALAMNVWVSYVVSSVPASDRWGIKNFAAPALIRTHAPFALLAKPAGAVVDLKSTYSIAELLQQVTAVTDAVLASPSAWASPAEAEAQFNAVFGSISNFNAWVAALRSHETAVLDSFISEALAGKWMWS